MDEKKTTSQIAGAANLGRNAGFVFIADLSFTIGRALTFFLLGIAVGSSELGRYVAVLGLAQLIFPICRLGAAHVMVRDISRNEPFAPSWGVVTTVSLLGAVAGSGVLLIASSVLFDVAAITVLLIGLGQFIGLGLQQAGVMASAAHGRSQVGLAVNAAGTLIRLVAILSFFYLVDERSVDTWAWFMASSMLLSGVSTVLIVRHFFDVRPRFRLPQRSDLSLGAGFVFVEFANTAQADIDKVVLGSFGLDQDTGVYAAAYRVAEMANLPLVAVVRASYSEFFRRGSDRIADAVRYARRLTMVSVAYGILAGLALWLAAPAFEFLMGDEFAESVDALRWIAAIPAIRASQVFPANVLTGTDRQWTRARLMSATAVLNLVMNIALVPSLGWRGAAISTLVVEVVFSGLLWGAVLRALRSEEDRINRIE